MSKLYFKSKLINVLSSLWSRILQNNIESTPFLFTNARCSWCLHISLQKTYNQLANGTLDKQSMLDSLLIPWDEKHKTCCNSKTLMSEVNSILSFNKSWNPIMKRYKSICEWSHPCLGVPVLSCTTIQDIANLNPTCTNNLMDVAMTNGYWRTSAQYQSKTNFLGMALMMYEVLLFEIHH